MQRKGVYETGKKRDKANKKENEDKRYILNVR